MLLATFAAQNIKLKENKNLKKKLKNEFYVKQPDQLKYMAEEEEEEEGCKRNAIVIFFGARITALKCLYWFIQ